MNFYALKTSLTRGKLFTVQSTATNWQKRSFKIDQSRLQAGRPSCEEVKHSLAENN